MTLVLCMSTILNSHFDEDDFISDEGADNNISEEDADNSNDADNIYADDYAWKQRCNRIELPVLALFPDFFLKERKKSMSFASF